MADRTGAAVKVNYCNGAVTKGIVVAATRFSAPGRAGRLAIYAHGLASSQKGDKSVHFRDPFLALGYDYVAFDFQGHGESPGELRDLTLTRQVEDLAAVAETFAPMYERTVIVGSSMGGWTAAWYAARNPGKISACLLIAPAFGFVAGLQRWIGEPESRRWRDEGAYEFPGKDGPFTLDYGIVEDGQRYPDEELYAAYRTPTFIVHGMKDESVPYKGSVRFAESAKGAPVEVLLIKDGDHRLIAYKDRMMAHFAAWLGERGR